MASLDWVAAATLLGLLLLAGGITGLLAGLFGIGGGTITVPVLYQMFLFLDVAAGEAMKLAVGTSLAVILPTSLRSFATHWRHGAVNRDLLRAFVLPVLLGVILGSVLVAVVAGSVLKAVFAVICALVAFRILFLRQDWQLAATLPGQPLLSVYGTGIGLFSTLMGIGGGMLNNLFMTFHGRSIHEAVATSSGLGFLIALPGTLGFIWAGWGMEGLPPLSLGYVSLPGVLAVIPASLALAPMGARLAHRLRRERLERLFGLFLLFVALRFFYGLLA